jgi:hypothetical protein
MVRTRTLTTHPILFSCTNTFRSNTAMHDLVNDIASKAIDIALVQEPWWGEIGGNVFASVAAPTHHTTILPTSPIPLDSRHSTIDARQATNKIDFSLSLLTLALVCLHTFDRGTTSL